MMLDYLSETQAAEMIEQAVWKAFENKRVELSDTGGIIGKMTTAVKAIQDELRKL